MKTKQIRNPRRLLILSPSSHSLSLIPSLLHTLTGHPIANPPATPTQTFAGYTTHPPLRIENKYYTAEVPIWVDEIPLSASTATAAPPETDLGTSTATATATATQWEKEFSGSEAQVVRDAIGAVMICIQNPEDRTLLLGEVGPAAPATGTAVEDREDVRDLKDFVRAIGGVRALIEEERGEVGDVPGLLVLGVKGESERNVKRKEKDGGDDARFDDEGFDDPFSVGWWEDQLCEMGLMGFEVVRWDYTGKEKEEDMKRNQYGELQGMQRIKEVLETHDWTAEEGTDMTIPEDDDLERALLGLDDEEGNGFNLEANELEREMVGLRLAIGRGGEDEDDEGDEELRVDAVEALLMRMRAIKEMSDELPAHERKGFAAKAVRDIMKEI